MPALVAVHHLKNYDDWIKLFTANPPPKVGRWRIMRGIEDRNRVHVVGEFDQSQVDEVKRFLASDQMRRAFSAVNEISTKPLEFVWLEEVKPG